MSDGYGTTPGQPNHPGPPPGPWGATPPPPGPPPNRPPSWVPPPVSSPTPPPGPPRRRGPWPTVVGVLAIAVLVGLVGFAIVVLSDDDQGRAAPTGETRDLDRGGPSVTATPRPDRTVTDRSDDEVINDALADIEQFWEVTFAPLYGTPYEPIAGGFHGYGPRTEVPPCPGIGDYEEIAQNAFYCPAADLIAWDEANLTPVLREEFGELTLGIVMAHEIGHAIQYRTDFDGLTVTLEQQADCFAGAWVRSVVDGRSDAFTVGPGELDDALAGMLILRDEPGVSGIDPGAHGTAFDRVNALQDGFENGPRACATYSDETVIQRLVAQEFVDPDDAAAGGNAPYEDIADLAAADLEDYWSTVFANAGRQWTPVSELIPFDPDQEQPACGTQRSGRDEYVGAAFYCEAEDYVAWDDRYLMPTLYNQGGDFAVATVIGEQYAVAVQARLDVQGDPLGLALQSDCLTGAWAADSFRGVRPQAPMVMSPGDLDEAILAMLALGDPPDIVEEGQGQRGSGFQRVSAFREGFLGADLGVCDHYVS